MTEMLTCHTQNVVEIGVDEAGRGPLIGRVYAAAVVWPEGQTHNRINDSKKLSASLRGQLRDWIEKNCVYSVAYASPREIDDLNILNATYLAMSRAIRKIHKKSKVDHILIDGNRFKFSGNSKCREIPYNCIVKGDATYYSIAAASILAKTYHDDHIQRLCKRHPELQQKYKLLNNMGYPTQSHIQAIREYGITKWHRKSFGPCK